MSAATAMDLAFDRAHDVREWLEAWTIFCCYYTDVFNTGCIGYWAYGFVCDEELGWLIFEHGGESLISADPFRAQARAAFERGEQLPCGYVRLDREAAKRAYEEGVRRWGIDWYADTETDAGRYDIVLQVALLGEVRYG